MVMYNRQNRIIGKKVTKKRKGLKALLFDLDWNPLPDKSGDPIEVQGDHELVPKPVNLKEMIRVCRILSKPFPQLRVDLYEVDGRIYFGELTFTPGEINLTFTSEYSLELGRKIDLSKVKRRKRKLIV